MATRASSDSEAWQLIPERPTLAGLRGASAGCRACGLWRNATQTVFGEGTSKARVMLVGEQPGDREDLSGRPFVGPAGKLLDRAQDEEARHVEYERFVRDLKILAARLRR